MATERPREIVPGAAADGQIPLATPDIGDAERRLVDESLRGGWVSYGPFVDAFEDEAARLVGAEHAVAVASGTAALHLALLAVGVGPGDEVVVPALSFVSPANAVRYCGASPVFLDAEPEYRQLDPERLGAFLEERSAAGRGVAAIVAVDVLGHPADLDAIGALAREHGVPVVEDAAEALGAELRGRPAGGLAEVGCLSFNGNKIVTCGSGGMVVTSDPERADYVRYLATQAKDDPLEYVHGEVGFNYRLSNVHAALGLAQMRRLPELVAAKRRIAAAYAEGLGDLPGVELPREAPWASCTFWLYTLHVDEEASGIASRELLRRLLEAGIQARPLWQPLHRSPAHAGAWNEGCEVADRLHATGLSVPCSIALTRTEQERVVEAIREAVLQAPGRPI